jgi:hypothetical protein
MTTFYSASQDAPDFSNNVLVLVRPLPPTVSRHRLVLYYFRFVLI